MDAVLRRMKATLAELPPHVRRAAGFILDQPQAVAVNSMRGLAGQIGVTPPTMLRLARRVGFDDYDSFRAVFQSAVTGGRFRRKAASLQRLGEQGGDAGVMASMADAAGGNLAVSFAASSLDDLVRAATVLRTSRQVSAVKWALGGVSPAPFFRNCACRPPMATRWSKGLLASGRATRW